LGFIFGATEFFAAVAAILIAHYMSSKTRAYALYRKSLGIDDPARKVSILKEAAGICPTLPYETAYGIALCENDNLVEAIPYIEAATKISPDPSGLHILALCLIEAERYREALDVLVKIDEKHEHEQYVDAMVLKAKCFYSLVEYDRSLEIISEVMRTRGDLTIEARREARIIRALVYNKTSQRPKAIKELEKLITEAPGYVPAQEALAELQGTPDRTKEGA
jgi:tetratricopeptide (TPR) repeat protein